MWIPPSHISLWRFQKEGWPDPKPQQKETTSTYWKGNIGDDLYKQQHVGSVADRKSHGWQTKYSPRENGSKNCFRYHIYISFIYIYIIYISYISQRLQKALKLSTVTSDTLLVKTFGNESPKLMSCDLALMSITATDGMELYVNAYSVFQWFAALLVTK